MNGNRNRTSFHIFPFEERLSTAIHCGTLSTILPSGEPQVIFLYLAHPQPPVPEVHLVDVDRALVGAVVVAVEDDLGLGEVGAVGPLDAGAARDPLEVAEGVVVDPAAPLPGGVGAAGEADRVALEQ